MAPTKGRASDIADPEQPALETSRDIFFRGGFEVLQPSRSGHRSGSDALLLAASLPDNASGHLVDLGSGAGVAGLAAAVANPLLDVTLVELDPLMAGLATESLALPANRMLHGRIKVLQADVTLSGEKREAAGLANNRFDHVIMNPPYNHVGQRVSPDQLRSLAHSMGEGGLDPWLRTAAAILKPGGMIHLIWRTERLGDVIAGCQGRFGGLTILPLHSRSGDTASRVIIRAIRGSKAPLAIASGIVLHDENDKATPLADAALNGKARLPFPA
ncbi:MAG: methyltransferase [Nitratireductor sp.]|nr:methyltransferase [Nitratireductor sp.]